MVSSMQMDPLIRERSQLLVDKKEEKPADNTGAEPGAVETPGILIPPASAPAATNAPPAEPPK